MKIVNDILHDLKEKRLWPVAAGLVVMIIVAFVMLSKPGASTVVGSAPAPTTSADEGPELSLTRASTTGFARAPRVNPKEIDPFGTTQSQYRHLVKKLLDTVDGVASGDTGAGVTTTTDTSGGVTPVVNSGGGGETPTNTGGGGTTEPSVPSTTPKTEKALVISVLVTDATDSEPKEITDVRTLSPLPDADNPFLVFVGKTEDGDAQFIVSSNVTATGDGTCSPSPTDCSTLTLPVGGTEKFVVTNTGDTTASADGSTTPGATTTSNISLTVTELGTKKVPVDDGSSDDLAVAARYQAKARVIGAGAVKAAITVNPDVGTALVKHGVKIN